MKNQSVIYNPRELKITFYHEGKPIGGMIGKCAVRKARELKLKSNTKEGKQ